MHRFRTSLALVVLTLGLALAGCPTSTTPLFDAGSDLEAGSDASAPAVPIRELGARYAETYCGILTECYGETIRNAFLGTRTEADCIAQFTRSYEQGTLVLYEAAIAAGTMSYDGTNADLCIAAIEALGCDVLDSRAPAACDELLIGEVALGDACSINEECEGDAYCRNDTACPGSCQPRTAGGTACTTDESCQSPMKCMNDVCTVPAGEGVACAGPTGINCAGGLICAGSNGTMRQGTCRTPDTVQSGALDGACNVQATQLCQPGLSCVVESFASMSCAPGGVAIGAACNLAVPDMCETGAFCGDTNVMTGDVAGTCAALPGEGEPCAMVPFGPRCELGLHCEGTVCRGTYGVGEACLVNTECYSGFCAPSGSCESPTLCGS